MAPIEVVEVAMIAATTGLVAAVVAVRRALRSRVLQRVEATVSGAAPRPLPPAPRVEPSHMHARRSVRGATSADVVRWPRGLR